MDEYSAYRSAELARLYDAVYSDCGDIAFWRDLAASAGDGPLLELGCGTGRILIPLARAGHDITGIDLASHMLDRCRAKLAAEPDSVRDRATVIEADMTSFELDRSFAQVFCAFGTFHHLRAADQQVACLERCRRHLEPNGTLFVDLINPDPAPAAEQVSEPTANSMSAGTIQCTDGTQVRSWATITGCDRLQQRNDCQITYEILGPDRTTRRLTETFPIRMVFRYELEHLLARCGFRVVELYGDYDQSPFSEESLGMIVVAEPITGGHS